MNKVAREQLWVGDMLVEDEGEWRRATADDVGTWWLMPEAPNYQAPVEGFQVIIAANNYAIGDEVITYDNDTVFQLPTQRI